MVLEATYEATFLTAVRKLKTAGNKKLFLTLVGGGVFGNPDNWLYDAILYNLKKFKNSGLDIIFVSYGASNTLVQKIIQDFKSIG
jgi:O-acetyl-ADP-ribose deacetylase (regulator of RNase III)